MYKIPTDEEVSGAIDGVFKKTREVASQSLFCELVLKELKKKSPYYTASRSRVKRIAALGGVKVFIEKNRSQKEITSCPVCGGALKRVSAKNLLGKKESFGKKCGDCGFASDKAYLTARRYIFYR